jgi:hypothetical protein
MLKLCLRAIGLFSTLTLTLTLMSVGAAGCSKSLESADAGVDHGVVADPAACGCEIVGYNLTMSWDCFCKQYNCAVQQPVPSCTGRGGWTRGCGLAEFSIGTVSGPTRMVFDASGTLVGEEFGTDDGQFSCPTDPSMIAYSVRAGQFPDTCGDAGTCQCSGDGGGCDPTDGGLSLDLF